MHKAKHDWVPQRLEAHCKTYTGIAQPGAQTVQVQHFHQADGSVNVSATTSAHMHEVGFVPVANSGTLGLLLTVIVIVIVVLLHVRGVL